ncbi:uncharacterized protein BT62DRAFT_1012954 [Guyanagaster necrorhizus]|uniref:Uncharacterized protein n=1 Tax=Guyanagaster necrorhizus TaxID=856835 RepID=A0A9P7VGM4_9AGAR|nr:uncharacterized protein BT62DRAFT_1012954 [Guyanagaster necrorhizus MCA 3950]KAG7440185.1 hypothetical protein BT62DRAFT_1012954 [Guyanagaster necrorhizus MCA 3950]
MWTLKSDHAVPSLSKVLGPPVQDINLERKAESGVEWYAPTMRDLLTAQLFVDDSSVNQKIACWDRRKTVRHTVVRNINFYDSYYFGDKRGRTDGRVDRTSKGVIYLALRDICSVCTQ